MDYSRRLDMYRMIEGFKLESPMDWMDKKRGGHHKLQSDDRSFMRTAYTRLYEERQCVSCVSWNPNLECGGWVAAGTAGGLLRVGDVSVDEQNVHFKAPKRAYKRKEPSPSAPSFTDTLELDIMQLDGTGDYMQ